MYGYVESTWGNIVWLIESNVIVQNNLRIVQPTYVKRASDMCLWPAVSRLLNSKFQLLNFHHHCSEFIKRGQKLMTSKRLTLVQSRSEFLV